MIEASVLAFVLILVRVAMFVALSPYFGDRSLPRMIKVGLAMSLAFAWFSSMESATIQQAARLTESGNWLVYAIAMIREGIFGAVLGYGFGLMLLPVRIAGSYIGQEMGLTMATLTDPATQTQANVVSLLFESIGMLMFFVMDIHHFILGILHMSFSHWPAGEAVVSVPIGVLSSGVAEAHQQGLQVAAPVAICMLLTLLVVSLMMKAVPQLNLFSIGLTLRIAVGLAALLVFLPEIISLVGHTMSQAAGAMSIWLPS